MPKFRKILIFCNFIVFFAKIWSKYQINYKIVLLIIEYNRFSIKIQSLNFFSEPENLQPRGWNQTVQNEVLTTESIDALNHERASFFYENEAIEYESLGINQQPCQPRGSNSDPNLHDESMFYSLDTDQGLWPL